MAQEPVYSPKPVYSPVVLFRRGLVDSQEVEAARKYFPVYFSRANVPEFSLVIPRYSALPFYAELQEDIELLGSQLLHTHEQHLYVADIRNWYADLHDITPKTWFSLHSIRKEKGPFVLKGVTNSKKNYWKTHMFAEDFEQAARVYSRLSQDGYVGYQDIVYRKYTPLRSYGEGIQGLPITEEYRFFVFNGKILSGAFYWSEHTEYLHSQGYRPDMNSVPMDFLNTVVDRVSDRIPFFVVDVAKTTEGDWIVIELNDGQMSGLSDNNPDMLYRGIKESLV